jgi:hypothetical protein
MSPSKGRFVVKDAAGKFSAFLLDGPGKVKKGDAVEWDAMPGQVHLALTNKTSNETLQVTSLALGVTRAHAEALLKL